MVQLTHASLGAFDKVTGFLRKSLASLESFEKKRWQAFVKFSELPDSFARDAILGSEGFSPILVIENLDVGGSLINGQFRPWEPDYIYMATAVAEHAQDNLDRSDKCRDFVQSTVLHETIHWALARYEVPEIGEPGVDFECAAYGSNLGRYWLSSDRSSCGTSLAHNDLDLDAARRALRTASSGTVRGRQGRAWPVITNHPRRLLVARADGNMIIGDPGRAYGTAWIEDAALPTHRRAGVDLYGLEGDEVVACEDGYVVAIRPSFESTVAVIVRCRSGHIIGYGGLADGSWLSVRQDDRIVGGQAIGRLRRSTRGAICHFEMYSQVPTEPVIWAWGALAPHMLVDPTSYLERLAREVS